MIRPMGAGARIAVAAAILLAALGCSAQAESPGATPSPGSSPAATGRQDISVTVDPKTVTGGAARSISITAACPLPQGGPDYRATARSDAFTGVVTLMPPVTDSPAPRSPTAPKVSGSAVISPDAEPGGYRVQVRCEATNDIGSASFRIVAPKAEPTKANYPTKAPQAGGGGTAAGGPSDESGLPTGVTVVVLLAAAGLGVGVARRRART